MSLRFKISMMLASVDSELVSLWDQLGLSDEERQIELNRLNALLQAAKEEPVEAARKERNSLMFKIDDLKKKHVLLLRCIGGDQKQIKAVETRGKEGTLRQRLRDVQTAFDEFEPIYNEKLNTMKELWAKIVDLCEKLELGEEERDRYGTFDENNISPAQEKRYESILKELETEAEMRQKAFNELKEKIEKIAGELGEEIDPEFREFLDSNPVSITAYEKAVEKYEGLTILKEKRAAQVTEFALEISHCWDLLRTSEAERKEFVSSHSLLSEENVQDCRNEIEKLRNLIVERLPELIVTVKNDIQEICNSLHNMPDATAELLEMESEDMDTFKKLDDELLRLKREFVVCQPILELIKQRNEILEEYEELMNTPDADKTQLDKIQRRKKCVLPRIEKKLLIQLIEYKDNCGYDFIWDGEVLANELPHIHLTATELNQTKRARKSSIKH